MTIPLKDVEPRVEPSVGQALPADFARAFTLMAHPLAGMAAMSTIGLGFASQALQIWASAMSDAVAASQRLSPRSSDTAETAPTVPAARVKLAVVTSLADVRIAAGRTARAVSERLPDAGSKAAVAAMPDAPKAVAPALAVAAAAVVDAVRPAANARIVKPVATRDSAPLARTGTKAKAVARPGVAAGKAPAAPTMAGGAKRPAAMERPQVVDDLKAISGIGPKLEQVLNGLGIWTYGQIAGWTAAETAWIEDHVGFAGRIGRDDWGGQAVALGATKTAN